MPLKLCIVLSILTPNIGRIKYWYGTSRKLKAEKSFELAEVTNSTASMEMVEWEVSPKKRRICSVEHYARFQTAYVLLQTEFEQNLFSCII
jgi:hypothetical protein